VSEPTLDREWTPQQITAAGIVRDALEAGASSLDLLTYLFPNALTRPLYTIGDVMREKERSGAYALAEVAAAVKGLPEMVDTDGVECVGGVDRAAVLRLLKEKAS
jgi:hypothetical protein